MIWFLRLFHAYRELEDRKRQLASEKTAMDDRCRWLESRLDASEERRTEAMQDALFSVKVNADFTAQQTIGRSIYGLAPKLPDADEKPDVIKSHTAQARDICNWRNSPEGLEELVAKMESEIGVTHDTSPS